MKIFVISFSLIILIGGFLYSLFFLYKKIYFLGIFFLLFSILWFFITKKNIFYLKKTDRLTGRITRKGKIVKYK